MVLVVRVLVAALSNDEPPSGALPKLAPAGQGSPSPLPVRAGGVHLVPMDGVPEARVRRVAGALSRQLDVRVRILPRLRIGNPDSVLGPTLAGVEELDRMGLEFRPPGPGEPVSC